MQASDSTGSATFLLLGKKADSIMSIPAAELFRAFPGDDFMLPPPIEELRGQTLTFEVRLPRSIRPGVYAEFNISRVWDLASRKSLPPRIKPVSTFLTAPPDRLQYVYGFVS
ncbi:hypothetical protein LINGRAHAP2_LOCUS34928 [Linum grandiflorum]